MQDARLIVMDEPSASLSATEAERLFAIVRELAAAGVAVLYVSHRLDEIVALCDRVTVFKDGLKVETMARGAFERDDLVRQIVGRQVDTIGTATPAATGPRVLELDQVARRPAVQAVSLQLHAGEILGLAGLVGSGRSELAEIIFGAAKADSGTMRLAGVSYAPASPAAAIAAGVALVPEERRSQGVLLAKSIAFNLNLPTLRQLRRARFWPLLDPAKGRRRAAATATRLTVKCRDVDQAVGQLSGGNQQKVVMGKWLVSDGVKVLVLDEPSKGVDVGARAEIYQLIRRLADDGLSVIVICSEFAELTVCDRVLVMVEGRIVGEARGESITEENLLNLCYTKGVSVQ
jgi:ribose transport system ATP-binding protein/rhamnose transport system ATP-binding protein